MATVEHCRSKRGSLTKLLKVLGLSRKKVDELLANPVPTIPDRIARWSERFLKKPMDGWTNNISSPTRSVVPSQTICAG